MTDQELFYTGHMPGRTLTADGKEYLYFSGTSYLGISRNQAFMQFLQEGFSMYGTNYSSSRNSNLRLCVFDEAETYLANFTGAEAALTMSSGYMAAQALVQTLRDSGQFLYAPDTHPALWRSPSDAPDSGISYDNWIKKLPAAISAIPDQHINIVCNSLDPLKAQHRSFGWIEQLPKDKQITLMLDDSHGIGVTGTNGAGVFSQVTSIKNLPHIRLLVVCSLGKAFGIPAGVILGTNEVIDQVSKSNYFGGASPAIPAYLYAFLQARTLFSDERKKLLFSIKSFLTQFQNPNLFSFLDNYPVFYTCQNELYQHLLKYDIMISSFRYPTPADEPVTRVVLNSLHTPEDLKRITDAISTLPSYNT